jgi:hypothetical protein
MDSENLLRKYLELKKPKAPIETPKMVETKKETIRKEKNKPFVIEEDDGNAINQIVETKPKIKVVCKYLQDRLDELNSADLD